MKMEGERARREGANLGRISPPKARPRLKASRQRGIRPKMKLGYQAISRAATEIRWKPKR